MASVARARSKPALRLAAGLLGLLAGALYLARILLPNLLNQGLAASDPLLPWVCLPPCALVAVAVAWGALRAYRLIIRREGQSAGWRSVAPGSLWDRHAIALPALCLSVAWVPYVLVFFRRSIAFGDLGGPLPLGTWGYWLLWAFQLAVCVVSHSLALRTIIRLYAPVWLIAGSLAFFGLSPVWGMLTVADVRHPLFAMMVCVLTSSVAFVAYGREVRPWLWVQLGAAALLVALLRSTGIWAVGLTLGGLVAWKVWQAWPGRRAVSGEKRRSADPEPAEAPSAAPAEAPSAAPASPKERQSANPEPAEAPSTAQNSSKRQQLVGSVLVLATVVGAFALLQAAGWSLPLGEPSYGDGSFQALVADAGQTRSLGEAAALRPKSLTADAGRTRSPWDDVALRPQDLVANDVPFSAIQELSVRPELARRAAAVIYAQQELPVYGLLFSEPLYVLVFGFFLALILVRRDGRALLVGLPQLGILAVMLAVPEDATLRFLLPVMAAQIMCFGALLRGVDVIGDREERRSRLAVGQRGRR